MPCKCWDVAKTAKKIFQLSVFVSMRVCVFMCLCVCVCVYVCVLCVCVACCFFLHNKALYNILHKLYCTINSFKNGKTFRACVNVCVCVCVCVCVASVCALHVVVCLAVHKGKYVLF